MDPHRRNKIKAEMQRAEEYLKAAEVLNKNGLFAPSMTSSNYCAFHATAAAFLTRGDNQTQKESFESFITALNKFNGKLDSFVAKLKEPRVAWGVNTGGECSENDALLRFYQTRDLFMEVKDFLRRTIKP